MLPGVNIELKDGGLGTIPPSADGRRAFVGVCSAGTANQIYLFSDPSTVESKLGRGPLTDAIVLSLRMAGGVAYGVPSLASIVGTKTADSGNPVSPVVGVTGTATEALEVHTRITKAGALGTGHFQISLDGGDTWGRDITLAATYPIPGRGLTLTFAAGSYTLNAVYKFVVTAPTSSIGEIQDAVRKITESPLLVEFIEVTQPGDNALWTVADALAEEAWNNKKFLAILCQAPAPGADVDVWFTQLTTYRASFTSPKGLVSVVAPWGEVMDPSGLQQNRNLSTRFGARLSKDGLADNPAHVEKGPIPGLIVPNPSTSGTFGKDTTYNKGHAAALDDLGYATIMRHPGRNGWYWVEGRTMADQASDFSTIMNVRVMNKFLTLQHQVWLDQVQGKVDPTNLQASLDQLLARSRAVVNSMVARQELVSAEISIPDGQDVLSSHEIIVEFQLVPFGYSKTITQRVSYKNPLLAQATEVPAAPAGQE